MSCHVMSCQAWRYGRYGRYEKKKFRPDRGLEEILLQFV